jgi:hypothetical protein
MRVFDEIIEGRLESFWWMEQEIVGCWAERVLYESNFIGAETGSTA